MAYLHFPWIAPNRSALCRLPDWVEGCFLRLSPLIMSAGRIKAGISLSGAILPTHKPSALHLWGASSLLLTASKRAKDPIRDSPLWKSYNLMKLSDWICHTQWICPWLFDLGRVMKSKWQKQRRGRWQWFSECPFHGWPVRNSCLLLPTVSTVCWIASTVSAEWSVITVPSSVSQLSQKSMQGRYLTDVNTP